jgi:5-methylcytosine-specific restriction endonuclease McrA
MAKISKSQKRFVAERAGHCCEYCISQEAYSPDYFSVEHPLPFVISGRNDVGNLAFSCQSCNNHKYIFITAIDPLTGQLAPIYNPREHIWAEHFAWADNFSIIEGISPIGRCTVKRLRLNRTAIVNLRLLLIPIGKHPPKR